MKKFTYVIKDPLGIHARPAGNIVAEAKKYTCNISINAKGKTGDLKKLFGLMSLCIKNGDQVEIVFDGDDEETAFNAIKNLFETSL